MKVDWKPIEGAEKNGIHYFLSGWIDQAKGERYVEIGYWNDAGGCWCDSDLNEELDPPTHYADHFMPDPPTG